MTTRKQRLTTRLLNETAKSLSPAMAPVSIWDDQIPGYHARVTSSGIVLRLYYRIAGRQRVYTLGKYGAITADAARKAAQQHAASIATGTDPRTEQEAQKRAYEREKTSTLRAYLESPYALHQRRKKSGEQTIAMISGYFEGWLDRPMSSLTRADVERWQAQKEAAGLQFLTIKRAYDALHGLLNHAVRGETLDANPLKGVKLEKPALTEDELAETAGAWRYLTPEEIRALFAGLNAYQEERREKRRNSRAHGKAHLPDLDAVPYVDHVVPWITTMFYTGFRPGDIHGLRWEHVDLDRKHIRKIIEKTAHHNPAPRTFPIPSPLADVLATWWKQNGEPKTGYVFPSPRTGGRLDKGAMRKPWPKVKELAELPSDLDLYTLRHSFASHLVLKGVDLLTVSRLMAHTDIETTIKNYGHLAPDHARAAVERFGKDIIGFCSVDERDEVASDVAG